MRIAAALAAAVLIVSFLADGQERKASGSGAVYRVEFDVHSKGDRLPAQHFSMLLRESEHGAFQAMSRVPTYTGSSQRIDVGANIECTVQEAGGKADLNASIELTSITGQVSLAALIEPIIGQQKAVIHTGLALGTPTVVMDDQKADLIRRVEATVTKVD